ncbi:hypothetical protein EYC80_007498 [Monilinia laxa]|uniref:Uncharacterized protein n=1 Tax=Monilinia laxa TaxID=61186 RepID=A0A5N6JW33_MONLA|nr:hypothetical protein EYC80_007498 [Monilinia laxa]
MSMLVGRTFSSREFNTKTRQVDPIEHLAVFPYHIFSYHRNLEYNKTNKFNRILVSLPGNLIQDISFPPNTKFLLANACIKNIIRRAINFIYKVT